MDITRQVSDLGASDRTALEHVVGRPLGDNQRLVIQIVGGETPSESPNISEPMNGDVDVPAWFNVLEGFTDQDLAEFDEILKRPVTFGHIAD